LVTTAIVESSAQSVVTLPHHDGLMKITHLYVTLLLDDHAQLQHDSDQKHLSACMR